MRTCGSGLFDVAWGMLVLALLSACSDGDDRAGDAGAASATGVRNAGGTSAVATGADDTCPLTAAEVGDVVGVAVRKDATICMFEPEPGKEPRVLYVRQVSFACSDTVVNDASFSFEPHEGLGIRAYTSPASGELLVCTDPPFEITVDITPALADIVADSDAASDAARASERAAAEELARLILSR